MQYQTYPPLTRNFTQLKQFLPSYVHNCYFPNPIVGFELLFYNSNFLLFVFFKIIDYIRAEPLLNAILTKSN